MSLINDALKRARQAQRDRPPAPASAPLQPAATRRSHAPSSGLTILLAAALVLGAAAMVMIYLGTHTSGDSDRELLSPPLPRSARPATAQSSSPSQPTADAPAKSEPPPVTPRPVTAPPISPPTTSVPAPTVAMDTNPPPPAPAPVAAASVATSPPPIIKPALPKLQGIFYRPDRPSALLNGKTVLVGGRSGEFLIVAITPDTVTVTHAGETNVLSLAE